MRYSTIETVAVGVSKVDSLALVNLIGQLREAHAAAGATLALLEAQVDEPSAERKQETREPAKRGMEKVA